MVVVTIKSKKDEAKHTARKGVCAPEKPSVIYPHFALESERLDI